MLSSRLSARCLVRCLLAVLCAVLPSACDNPADDAQKASTSEPKPVASNPGAAGEDGDQTESLPILESSHIGFVGSKVTGSHTGGFKTFSGTVKVLDGRVVGAEIDIDMNSTYSDSEKLTGHLKSPDFFDTAKFPQAQFVVTEIREGAEAEKMPEATHTITGNLTLHGETRSITFAALVVVVPAKVTVKSEFAINRKDFGIVYSGKADDLIRDDVLIKLNVDAAKS